MKRFDLYRITIAYLGLIFVACAVVVFDPLRGIWPGEALELAKDSAEPRIAPSQTLFVGQAAVPAERDTLPKRVPEKMEPMRAAQDADVDPAEVVAALVAQSFGAADDEDVGEGDASAQTDWASSPEAELVTRGSDVAYTVGQGDSLGSLALRFYGDAAL